MKIKSILAVLALALAGVSFAKTDSTFPVGNIPYNSKGDVEPGEWTSQYAKARAQAEAEDKPLLVYWGNNGCGHCEALERAIGGSAKFASWQKEYGIYMVFTIGGSTFSEAAVAKEAARDSSGQFPYIGVYWHGKKQGSFSGNGISVDAFISKTEALLKGYSPTQGGTFAYSEIGEHRYEAESTTKTVSLKMIRDAKGAKQTGKDSVKVTGPNGYSKTYSVTWEIGDKEKFLSVAIPAGTFTKVGQKLTAVINDKAKEKGYSAVIHYVNAENGAANPDPTGAEFGRWTMDLEKAKEIVKNASGKAYTLVSVQGSLWCPDCANTERNFLNLKNASGENRFREWAAKNKIALVVVDIPNFTSDKMACDSPCLLKTGAYETTIARPGEYPASGASEADTEPVARSGLSYLSRKGVSEDDAAALLKRNWKLVNTTTAEGGFNRPGNEARSFRTGVPIFVLLNKSGKAVARFTRLASVSPKKADRDNFNAYIRRIQEMMDLADEDASEIENNYPSSKSIKVNVGGTKTSTLCHADMQDSFLLNGLNGNVKASARVFSEQSTAMVSAQFYLKDASGAIKALGQPQTKKLSPSGWVISQEFTEPGSCYLLVQGTDVTAPEFKVDNAAKSFVEFKVKSETPELLPQEVVATASVGGVDSVKIRVLEGKTYRITGVASSKLDKSKFEVLEESDKYKARVSDTVDVPLEASVSTIEYQRWVSSKVAFPADPAPIKESKSYALKITRSGGVSGEARVKVSVNTTASTYYFDWETKKLPRFNIEGEDYPFVSKELVWKEGETGAKTLTIVPQAVAALHEYYGDGQIVFELEGLDGTKLGKSQFVLKVQDEEEPLPSVVSISKSSPEIMESGMVYSRVSGTVTLTLARDGEFGIGGVGVQPSVSSVQLTGGEDFIDSTQLWGDHDRADRTIKTTKGTLPAVGKSVKISLKQIGKMFQVDEDASFVKILSIADDAPAFASASVTLPLVYGAKCGDAGVDFDSAFLQGGKLSAVLLYGELPTGLSFSVDQKRKRLTFSGAATKTGKRTVWFRAVETRGGKEVKGMPVKVIFNVVDISKVDAGDKTYGRFANPWLAKSRTLTDLPILVNFASGAETRLAGVLTVTIPKKGNVSASYRCRRGKVGFSCAAWEPKDLGDKDGDGSLRALLTSNTKGYDSMTLVVYPNGNVEVGLVDRSYPSDETWVYSEGKPWGVDGNTAKAWAGIYNSTLIPGGTEVYRGENIWRSLSGKIDEPENASAHAPQGCGYVNFRMTTASEYNAGKMTWAGMLPNGTAISGTAVLSRGLKNSFGSFGRKNYAYLPLFLRSDSDLLAVVAEIKLGAKAKGLTAVVAGTPDAYSGLPLGEWSHTETVKEAKASYRMDLHLFGSYYDPDISLVQCCEKSFAKTDLELSVTTLPMGYAYYDGSHGGRGNPADIEPLDVKVSKNSIKITTPDAENPCGVTLNLGRSTGVLSGSFKMPFKYPDKTAKTLSAKWKGVLLVGWGEECACGEGTETGIYLPFVCGGYYFTDKVPYKSGGKTLKLSPTGGGAIQAVSVNKQLD